MDYLRNWREYIPIKDRLFLLALVAVIVIGFADVLLVRSSIIPPWREKGDLASQLDATEKELEKAQKAQESSPDQLRKQIEAAQARLSDVASAFLSDSQAAETRNKLYQYASESQVEIANLQTLPPPEEESSAYDVTKFRLEATGSLPDLMDFLSRIEEAKFESFVMTNVNITEGEGQNALSMDITLYTSPYSFGAVVQPTPSVAPLATPASLAQLETMLAPAWAAKEWEQAIGLIEQILALDPDYEDMVERLYEAHVGYGSQLLEEGDPDGATAQFNSALEIKSDGAEALAGLQQAATWVTTPVATPTDTPAPVATPTAMPPLTVEEQLEQSLHELWAAKDWEEAIGVIEQILDINPDYAAMTEKLYAAHVNYGRQLAAEGRLEEAKQEFTRALEINPDGGEAMAELQALAAGETPVPSATPTPQAQYIIHVVQSGEWLLQIARMYGTTSEAIMTANGLTDSTIHAGQELRIPTQ